MRIVFFGSGAFGLPTLRELARAHEVALVVTQPDRPAGRHRKLSETPVSAFASRRGLRLFKPEDVNTPDSVSTIREARSDCLVVIAFGQKLGRTLRGETFAINLHASLLPRYRGAAPVNWAIINGESTTGLSVITLEDRIDAGDVLGQTVTPIDPLETAGELHDRLADLGPGLVLDVLERQSTGRLRAARQDEAKATRAPKLTKADGTVTFEQSAISVRNRIHGLTPWPGCRVRHESHELRIHRVSAEMNEMSEAAPGTIMAGGRVACASGCIKLLAVQPAGGRLMTFEAYQAGHAIPEGGRLVPMDFQP
jgi:methionyl-tRNA formyltransferase